MVDLFCLVDIFGSTMLRLINKTDLLDENLSLFNLDIKVGLVAQVLIINIKKITGNVMLIRNPKTDCRFQIRSN